MYIVHIMENSHRDTPNHDAPLLHIFGLLGPCFTSQKCMPCRLANVNPGKSRKDSDEHSAQPCGSFVTCDMDIDITWWSKDDCIGWFETPHNGAGWTHLCACGFIPHGKFGLIDQEYVC